MKTLEQNLDEAEDIAEAGSESVTSLQCQIQGLQRENEKLKVFPF